MGDPGVKNGVFGVSDPKKTQKTTDFRKKMVWHSKAKCARGIAKFWGLGGWASNGKVPNPVGARGDMFTFLFA